MFEIYTQDKDNIPGYKKLLLGIYAEALKARIKIYSLQEKAGVLYSNFALETCVQRLSQTEEALASEEWKIGNDF